MNYPLLKPRRLTVAEFREMELNAPEEERWELIAGQIVRSMAGGTARHNLIVQNISSALQAQLRRNASPCRTFTENMRLDATAAGLSTLPDVVVSCEPPRGGQTTMTDATAVIEVHSTASRSWDKGRKLDAYISLPGVRTVVLVEQEAMSVVVYTRAAGKWVREDFRSPDDRFVFDGVDASITLAQVYEDVEFD